MGWIGTRDQLTAVLEQAECDQDEDGKYIVRGGISSFLGAGYEFVVDDSAQYRCDGEWKDLEPILPEGEHGLRVKVI